MRFSMAKMAGNNNKKRPYGLLVLLGLGMAVMCAVVLHQLREGRVLSLLIQERDQQFATLQILLQKERENTKEMKRKIDDMKAKTIALRNQKMELTDKLSDTRNIAAQLKKMRTELEAALVEKQIQVDQLTDKVEEFLSMKLRVVNLTSLLKQKEDEVEEMKKALTKQALAENSQGSLSVSEEERKGEWAKFQINKDDVDLKPENVSSRNQTVGIEEIIGSSSNQSTQKTQDVEGKKTFSFDDKSRTDFESSDRNFSSSRTEMEGIKQVTDKMGDEKNDKLEEDQRKKDDEKSKAEGPSSSSKDLQLQETDNNSEVGQSTQKDKDGFTETIQKKAKSIGQSETVENTEESLTESKTSDEKQAESEGQSENSENLED